MLAIAFAIHGLIGGAAEAQRAARPVQIGALTESWGSTPAIIGLRDGLRALGYREDQDFTIGVRFTQGESAELLAAARELVRGGADIIVTTEGGNSARAAQMATDRIPNVNGMLSVVVKNLPPGAGETVSLVAFTPRPRVVKLQLLPVAEERTQVAGPALPVIRYHRQGLGPPARRTEQQDQRRRSRSEKHQNFSEGVPAGQVRGKCRITSCQFISFSCIEDLHPERFFRVNIRSESESDHCRSRASVIKLARRPAGSRAKS